MSTEPSPTFNLLFALTSVATKHAPGYSHAMIVGGGVRDMIIGVEPKDYDVELFGVEERDVEPLLAKVAPHVLRVGRSFPVWKIWTDDMGQGEAIDVALPRREIKLGEHHTDFSVTLDPHMSFKDSGKRRDFTINAIGYRMDLNDYRDPHHGRSDLYNRVLRHVSPHFAEDPLRVLRGMQFCARFDLTPAPETIELCRTLTPEHISRERLMEEWSKLILKGVKISKGLDFLRAVGWDKHFPEIAAVTDVPQQPSWHPEGPVHLHLNHCLDYFAATRTGNEREDLIMGFATLCHDLGKSSTTAFIDGRWKAKGHEAAGEGPTRSFLARLTNDTDLIEDVVSLVVTHMIPSNLYTEATKGETVKTMARSVRRLSQKVRLDRLARLVLIDKSGRPPLPQVSPEAEWLSVQAANLGVVTRGPEPLLKGRHLIDLGMKPSTQFGQLLNRAMELQLDGDITTVEQAIEWARQRVNITPLA